MLTRKTKHLVQNQKKVSLMINLLLFDSLSLYFIRKLKKCIYILGSLISVSKNTGQSSMMKFLTNSKCNQQNEDNTCDVLTLTTQGGNIHNTINPNNVKLLSDDNTGIDFLTLCTVKKSEEEMVSEMRKMDTTYIPVAKSVKDPFNFVIPDIKILDSLPHLTNLINLLATKHETCKVENTQNDNVHVNIDDDNFWCTIRNERNIDTNEVRFEDILDDSSDTNITTISHASQAINEFKIDSVDKSKVPASSTKNNDEIMTDHARTELSNNTLNDMEPSIFENILNDSFSSIDDDLDVDTARQSIVPPNSSNIFSKNAENMNVTCESVVDIFLDDTNANGFNQNLSVSVEPAQPVQTNKSAENCIDEIQDLYFSDDDMAEFICNKPNDSKPMHNPKPEESFLSITQAIKEMAQIKKDLEKPPILSASKRDSSPDWISTDTKRKTEVKKRTTLSELKNKLSGINLNSTTKSCAAKQHFDLQDDSDEDFMITHDSAKKFDELESSYFCHTSKALNIQSNRLRNMSESSIKNNNYFDDTSKVFASGSSNLCGTSKRTTPLGMSVLVNNRRPMLSLKRNKDPYSSTIDLSAFKVPNKCIKNRQEQNTIESGVNISKQISHLERETARKISSQHNKRKKKKQKNVFIDDEAQVSSDGSSDESISTTDEELHDDFVSYTQNVENQVDMQAHYLQTTKSLFRRPGAFHFKKPPSPDPDIEIYSQALSQVQDSYLYVRMMSNVHLKISTLYLSLIEFLFSSIVGFVLCEGGC